MSENTKERRNFKAFIERKIEEGFNWEQLQNFVDMYAMTADEFDWGMRKVRSIQLKLVCAVCGDCHAANNINKPCDGKR